MEKQLDEQFLKAGHWFEPKRELVQLKPKLSLVAKTASRTEPQNEALVRTQAGMITGGKREVLELPAEP